MKPGVQSSEFYTVVATLLAGPLVLASLCATVASYVLSRGWAKRGAPPPGLPQYFVPGLNIEKP